MSYNLPLDIEQRVKAQIDSGAFETEEDVLREAMGTLEKRQRALEELRNMVREAEDDVAAGRIGYFDVDKTMQAVRERLAKETTS